MPSNIIIYFDYYIYFVNSKKFCKDHLLFLKYLRQVKLEIMVVKTELVKKLKKGAVLMVELVTL